MTKILFVCHGNICRSPMAQSVMTHLVTQAGLKDFFQIDSAATSREEIGNPVHPGTRKKLRAEGIPLIPHTARQMRRQDYGEYDLLIHMDRNNFRNMYRIVGNDPQGKIRLLLDFTPRPSDIADPWYTGEFDAAYRDILEGCRGLLTYCRSAL